MQNAQTIRWLLPQTIRWLFPISCLSVFEHFVGLRLKRYNITQFFNLPFLIICNIFSFIVYVWLYPIESFSSIFLRG